MRLDAIDLRILDAVQREGRITKLRLAEVAGLSPSPCWVRLRRLERAGIITGYHARLAPVRVAPIATVIMEVTLANHRQADFQLFERAVAAYPEVLDCWSVGGGMDYVLRVVARDVDAYQRLVDRMLAAEIGIERYFSYIVTRVVKEDAPIPLKAIIETEAHDSV